MTRLAISSDIGRSGPKVRSGSYWPNDQRRAFLDETFAAVNSSAIAVLAVQALAHLDDSKQDIAQADAKYACKNVITSELPASGWYRVATFGPMTKSTITLAVGDSSAAYRAIVKFDIMYSGKTVAPVTNEFARIEMRVVQNNPCISNIRISYAGGNAPWFVDVHINKMESYGVVVPIVVSESDNTAP